MLAFVIIFLLVYQSKEKKLSSRKCFISVVSLLLIFMGLFLYDRSTFYALITDIIKSGYIFILAVFGVSIFVAEKKHTLFFFAVSILSGCLLTEFFVISEVCSFPQEIMQTAAFNNLQMVYTLCFYGITALIIYDFYKAFKKEKIDVSWLVFCLCAFISCYAAMMAAGDPLIQSRPTVFAAPICVAYVLNRKTVWNKFKNTAVCSTALMLFSIIMCQKTVSAYSWWGSTESDLHEETCSIDIRGLEGFRVSSEQSKMFEEVYKSIIMDSSDGDRILGFPGVTIFNLLTDRLDLPGKVPVYFYDVCADKYAEQDAEHFYSDPPEIVIWWDIPGCLETHEAIFRNGNTCGQRKIISWFQNSKEQYTEICQVNNVFVYKINNGEPIKYRYIEDSNRVNETLAKEY